MIKKLDQYILKRFLVTFFFSVLLTIAISVVIDFSEKVDDFIDSRVNIGELLFDYYIYFIPYMYNLFSPIFVFVAAIFMTSKMAASSEIIAILAGGISYSKFLRPYLIGALILGVLSFVLNAWVIPNSEQKRIAFINQTLKGRKNDNVWKNNIHFQIDKGKILYFGAFNYQDSFGIDFTYEQFEGTKLKSKLFADRFEWNRATKTWSVKNYFYREYHKDGSQGIRSGKQLDVSIHFNPEDIFRRNDEIVALKQGELKDFIASAKERGVENVKFYELERYRRISNPFAALILTIIGVTVSSRKVRGGIGLHLGVGMLLGASFVFVGQMVNTYATAGGLDPAIAVWIPVVLYLALGYYLYKIVPK